MSNLGQLQGKAMQDDQHLIQSIYDTALHPGAIGDLLQQIAERMGAYGAMIFDCTTYGNQRVAGLQYLSDVYDRQATLDYVARYNDFEVADQDRLADLSTPGNRINLIHDRALYSDTYPPGENVAAMKRRGVTDRIGGLLNKEIWNADRFAFQFIAGSSLPDEARVRWAEDMLAHLGKALSIGRSIETKRLMELAFIQVLDALPFGLAIITPQSQVAYRNPEFARLVQDRSELEITRNGDLEIRAASNQSAINNLLQNDSAHGRFGARPRQEAVFLPFEQTELGLFIEICPLQHHPDLDNFGTGARLVSVFDGTKALDVDLEQVQRFFPLSKSEIVVLGLVSNGYSNIQIAEERGRSVETVNSQLKSILKKTNTRNRTELVKVAMGLSGATSIRPSK